MDPARPATRPARFARLTPPGDDRAPVAILAGLIVLSAAAILVVTRRSSFYGDEWAFILGRRGLSASTFLMTHGPHPVALPVAVYKVMLAVFGLGSYTPYLIVLVLVHAACAALMYVYARRLLGAWAALVPAALLLFLGAAWEDLVWPFQIAFLGSVAFGLALLLALGSEPRRDGLAALFLLGSALCSLVSLGFVAAAFTDIVIRRGWRRAWILAPAVIFLLVSIEGYGTERAQLGVSTVSGAVRWVPDMAAAGIAAPFGLSLDWGRPLLLGLVVLAIVRCPRDPGRLERLAVVTVGALGFWFATGLGRETLTGGAAASRYVYPSAVFLMCACCAMLAGRRPGRGEVAAVAALTLLACVAGLGLLRDGANLRLQQTDVLVPELSALQVAGPIVPASLQVDPARAPDIFAGRYRQAVRDFGSPAPPDDLRGGSAARRQTFDATLVRLEGLALTPGELPAPAQRGAAPTVVSAGAPVAGRGGCLRFTPTAGGAPLVLAVRPGTLAFGPATGSVGLGRLTPAAPGVALPLPASGAARLALPRDGLPTPWRVTVAVTTPVRVCSVRP